MNEIVDAQKIGEVGPADPDPYNRTTLIRALERADEAEAGRRAALDTIAALRDEITTLKATLVPALDDARHTIDDHERIFARIKELMP